MSKDSKRQAWTKFVEECEREAKRLRRGRNSASSLLLLRRGVKHPLLNFLGDRFAKF
jgi:hypothetical protein